MSIYPIASILLLVGLHFFIRLARRYQLVDRPNHRSSHNYEPVRGGGIVFVLAGLLWFMYESYIAGPQNALPYLISGFAAIALVSFLDDLYTLPSRVRIMVHAMAVVLLAYQLQIELPWYLWMLGGVFFLGWVNAFNFMDGINGLTALYTAITLISLLVVNYFFVSFTSSDLLSLLLIATGIFTWFNFRKKALCFAGDVGAISMAFLLGYFLVHLILTTGDLSFILMVVVYAVDAVGTIIERLIKKEAIFQPHRLHLYQLYANEKGVDHRVVSVGYALTQLLINAIILWNYQTNQSSLIPASLFLIVVAAYTYLKIIKMKAFQGK
ncbi:MAG: UDP-GlcNAc:undecaprenyl-phosphate GlcNAc-1-phosphate transferase [Nonlabens sp.]